MNGAAALTAALLTAAATGQDGPLPPGEVVRGITLSTHRSGQEWGSDAVVPALTEMQAIGAQWVAIHPYARIGADGSVRFRSADAAAAPAEIARPILEAHRLGLKILVKPHLAYWGSPFRWRGEITFASDAAWNLFWTDYRRWILTLATWAKDADGFVVGTELDRTLHCETQWRALIGDVRRSLPCPLTYAANWTDFRRVPFWDALDVVGIQAYFPIVADPAAGARRTFTADELVDGWRNVMRELHRFAHQQNRNILFTELGYNRSYAAPLEPWASGTDDAGASPVQEACMAAALQAIDAEPAVLGAFLWKWFVPPRSVGRDFQLATPAMRALIGRHWQR